MKINTLHSTTQRGAQRSIRLMGAPDAVQREAFHLFNTGVVGSIPDEYKEGIDSDVTLASNDYRLGKVADATAKSRVKRQAGQRMAEAVASKRKLVLANLKTLLRPTIASWEASPAHEYAIASCL